MVTPRFRIAILVSLLAFGLLTGCTREVRAITQNPSTSAPRASDSLTALRTTAIVRATDRVASAVVSLRVTRPRPAIDPDCFFFFCGPQQETPQSFGTGFIVRADGIILTNQHVVADARQITVTLADGTDVEGILLGEDPLTDIAVIRINRADLPVVTIGRSSDLMIGEWAIAVGNPYSFMLGNAEPTVTAGVISATRRNIVPSRERSGLYLDMIQTDAAINPGNSGGPLTNALGEVIGVNSSIFSSSGGSVGIGFAIPIERAMRVAQEIIRNGAVQRAWTGLDVAGPGSPQAAKQTGGVAVTLVLPDGPAAQAGLQVGDVMLQANGLTLRNYLDWESVKLDLHVGDTVAIATQSGGERRTRTLKLGPPPTALAAKVRALQGLEVVTVTPAIRTEHGIRSTQGALIFRISPELAAQTGFQAGDVIVGVEQVRVTRAEDVQTLFNQAQRRGVAQIAVERGGQVYFVQVPLR